MYLSVKARGVKRLKDATLLDLKMENEATKQERTWSRSQKRQENPLPTPKASRKNQPCPHLVSGPGTAIADFRPPELGHNKLVLF